MGLTPNLQQSPSAENVFCRRTKNAPSTTLRMLFVCLSVFRVQNGPGESYKRGRKRKLPMLQCAPALFSADINATKHRETFQPGFEFSLIIFPFYAGD